MLYQPIWLYALCDLYWGQVHAAKLISGTYYITYGYMIACMYISGSYYISPSGCVHYVTCIGNRYMLQLISTHIISLMIIWLHVLYISEHILYQPIWLCALCSLYWEQVHAAKLISTHIICDYMIACNVHIATYIYIYPSVWLCALCNLYWGTGTCCKLIPKIHVISLLTIWLHVMCISQQYYISPSGCVHYVTCIGGQVHAANLYRKHILYHLWLCDCM